MTIGSDLIATERQRQIDEEGYTSEHDAYHDDSSLVGAAVEYALEAARLIHGYPLSAVRNLVKAGALIAAEIDRLESISR